MKLPILWLKEHLETSVSAHELVAALEKIGATCETVYFAQEAWFVTEIVKIVEKRAHPNADKLNLYTILLKNGETLEIVCGDASLEPGDHVPYAKPGVVIPNGNFMLKIAKIRGVDSPGMLCAASELCLPLPVSGVLKCYASDFGKTIAQAYEDSAIIELEITPNRGDLLSVRGVARALSHHGVGQLKDLAVSVFEKCSDKKLIAKNSDDVLGCCAALLEYQAGATTPEIAKRLQLTDHGVTGIDVVDLTNYVAHEIGQPVHAFDYDKLEKTEPILNFTNLEKPAAYKTLQNNEIILDAGTLVIKNADKIVSWPGVIGGENSKTENMTSRILLESGIFKIDSMQRRKHKLYTSAARKFECGVDIANMQVALMRLCHLLGSSILEYQVIEHNLSKKIKISACYISKVLGVNYNLDAIVEELSPRGYVFEKLDDDSAFVEIPSYKYFDMTTQNCVAEELIMGHYDKIISKNLPPIATEKKEKPITDDLKAAALNLGFFEVYNFSLTKKEHAAFNLTNIHRQIANASNQNYSIMRGTLVPGMLKIAQWHVNNNYPHRDFFEIGLIFGDFDHTDEKIRNWHQKQNFAAISQDYKALLSIAYLFFERIFVQVPAIEACEISWSDDGACFKVNDAIIVQIGRIKAEILNEFGLANYFAIEFNLENFHLLEKRKLMAMKSQTPIYKDISFNLAPGIEIGKLLKILSGIKAPNLEYAFEVFDVYPNEQLSQSRNVGVRFTINSNEHLSSEDLNKFLEKIKESVAKNL